MLSLTHTHTSTYTYICTTVFIYLQKIRNMSYRIYILLLYIFYNSLLGVPIKKPKTEFIVKSWLSNCEDDSVDKTNWILPSSSYFCHFIHLFQETLHQESLLGMFIGQCTGHMMPFHLIVQRPPKLYPKTKPSP